jgi:hypothetical protein
LGEGAWATISSLRFVGPVFMEKVRFPLCFGKGNSGYRAMQMQGPGAQR